jgi:hypothetical protein
MLSNIRNPQLIIQKDFSSPMRPQSGKMKKKAGFANPAN